MTEENDAYSRIDTKKIAKKKVPLKWLNEDSCWFLMREYVLSGDKSKYGEAEKLIQRIETLRLAKGGDNKPSLTTIGRLLTKLKVELNKRK
jgi:hypothetical protein